MDINSINENLENVLAKPVDNNTLNYLIDFTKYNKDTKEFGIKRLINLISKDGVTETHNTVCHTLNTIVGIIEDSLDGKFEVNRSSNPDSTISALLERYRSAKKFQTTRTNIFISKTKENLSRHEVIESKGEKLQVKGSRYNCFGYINDKGNVVIVGE